MNKFNNIYKQKVSLGEILIAFKDYVACTKCELLKLNHIKLSLIVLIITLISVAFTYFINLMNIEEHVIALNSDKLIYDLHLKIFLFISFPLINSFFASKLYKLEFSNNTKRAIYTLPIKRSMFFFSKLSVVILYNLFALLILGIIVISLRQYYMSSFGVHFSLTINDLAYMVLSSVIVVIAAVPILSLHLWFSSIKLSSLLNIVVLIGITASSAFLYIKHLPNQWYNIYLYPLSAQKNFSKETYHFLTSSDWKWFYQDSFDFIIFSTFMFTCAFFFLITNFINKVDSKY